MFPLLKGKKRTEVPRHRVALQLQALPVIACGGIKQINKMSLRIKCDKQIRI